MEGNADMLAILKSTPKWESYDVLHENTAAMKKYFDPVTVTAGGPLSGDLSTINQVKIVTPLMDYLKDDSAYDSYGFFDIKKI